MNDGPDTRKVVGAAPGPREGQTTVVCDDGAVFVGLSSFEHYVRGVWVEHKPIPGSQRAREWGDGLLPPIPDK